MSMESEIQTVLGKFMNRFDQIDALIWPDADRIDRLSADLASNVSDWDAAADAFEEVANAIDNAGNWTGNSFPDDVESALMSCDTDSASWTSAAESLREAIENVTVRTDKLDTLAQAVRDAEEAVKLLMGAWGDCVVEFNL